MPHVGFKDSHSGHAVLSANGYEPLKHWDSEFEFRYGNRCMSVLRCPMLVKALKWAIQGI